jgi:cell division protein FtsQ
MAGRSANPMARIWAVSRWSLVTAAAVGALAGAILSYQAIERLLVQDPKFRLARTEPAGGPEIALEGLGNASRDRVLEVFAEDAGRSLYLLPISERRRQLLAIDWVRDATVVRLWPNRVRVRLAEREPAAFVRLAPRQAGAAYHTALIDAEGVILEIPEGARYDLPLLTGVEEGQSREMRALRVRRMLALLAEIGELGERVSEVDAENPNNLKVMVNAGGQLVQAWLGRERYLYRLRRFLQYFAEVRRRYPAATTFDLRLEDRITVIDGVSQ